MQHVLTQLKLVYVETKQDFYTFIVSLICLFIVTCGKWHIIYDDDELSEILCLLNSVEGNNFDVWGRQILILLSLLSISVQQVLILDDTLTMKQINNPFYANLAFYK